MGGGWGAEAKVRISGILGNVNPKGQALALTLLQKRKTKKKGMMAVGGEPPTAFKRFPDP